MNEYNFIKKGIYYFPNFTSSTLHDFFLQKIIHFPKPLWIQLSNRRLVQVGAQTLGEKSAIHQEFPSWLKDTVNDLTMHLKDTLSLDFYPNQCLVNEYCVGQGILPHEDGPCFEPLVATISLGCHTVLNFIPLDSETHDPFSILLEPKSLVIVSQDAYMHYKHGIQETNVDVIDSQMVLNVNQDMSLQRECTRYSLTFRRHLKVIKNIHF